MGPRPQLTMSSSPIERTAAACRTSLLRARSNATAKRLAIRNTEAASPARDVAIGPLVLMETVPLAGVSFGIRTGNPQFALDGRPAHEEEIVPDNPFCGI